MIKTIRHYCVAFSAAVMAMALTHPALAAFPIGTGISDGTIPSNPNAPVPTSGSSSSDTLGSVIQNVIDNTSTIPGLLSGFSYIAGIAFGFMAILKFRAHVEAPNSVEIWDPMKRTIAAGSFFALPTIISAAMTLVSGDEGSEYAASGFSGKVAEGGGLDAMIVALMSDIFVPMQWLFGWFGYIAGIFLVLIGISRLLKTEQQGPTGPTGIGTIMTFVVAGCLFSLNSMIGFASSTLFGESQLKTNAMLKYTSGLEGAADHMHAVISAIIAFAIVLGWVSLIRGFFILRGVSEGSSQASMMTAITHIIGGTLAVNLGAIINAVQSTLGIAQYGIFFK